VEIELSQRLTAKRFLGLKMTVADSIVQRGTKSRRSKRRYWGMDVWQ
jgi:hypothetical protein